LGVELSRLAVCPSTGRRARHLGSS